MSLSQVAWVMTLPLAALFLVFWPGLRTAGRTLTAAAATVAALGLAGDLAQLAFQRELADWVPVEGRVVVSERGVRRNDWTFEYEYAFAGATHRGSRLTYAPRWRSREDTDQLAAAYPVGAALTVYVDPDRPERSSVDAAPRWAVPAVGLALHGGLAVALALGLRRAAGPAASG